MFLTPITSQDLCDVYKFDGFVDTLFSLTKQL